MLSLYNFEHTIGWHFYDIPALVVLILAALILGVHFILQKKREKEYEDELKDDEYAADIR